MDVPFAELLRLQREGLADLAELQRLTHCGEGCGLCLPYIRASLATGRERFPVMSEDALAKLAGDGR
jgi:bacterioferritin-associated ferredoxin